MKNKDYPILDVEVFADKWRIRVVFFSGMGLVAISIACMIWALANWEEYSETCVYIFVPGSYHDCGFAPSVFNWALTFITLIPLIFFLTWITLDLKRPVIGVNRYGLFINHKFFKRTFLKWNEFSSVIKMADGGLELRFKDAEEVVCRQPPYRRYLLKTTYLKKKLPFVIDPEMKYLNLIEVAARNWRVFGPDAGESE